MASEGTGAHGTALRSIVLVTIGLLALAASVLTLPTAWSPAGVFGWNISPDGATVMSVTRGYPAAAAGIVPGDKLVYDSLSLRARINAILVSPLRPGESITFLLEHGGGRRKVTLTATPWPITLTATSTTAGLLIDLISIGVGLALVALRPNTMTWAFLFYGITALAPFGWNSFVLRSDVANIAVLSASYFLGGISGAAAFIFIGRFPSGEYRPWTPWLDRAAVVWFVAVAASAAYVVWALLASSVPPDRWILFAVQYGLPGLGGLTILAALVANYVAARGALRHRIAPVLTVFALSTFFTLLASLVNDLTTQPVAVYSSGLLAQLLEIAFPLTVAYAVVRHRVMDINFAFSRTLVYTILTGGIVATFALIHYLVGKVLESTRVAVLIELVLAVAYGVWLQAIHDRVDGWIDRVLFRRRHLAERRLERFAVAIVNAESDAFVDEMLVAEPIDALDLASAAVFRSSEGPHFARREAFGWSDSDARSLDGLDRIVVELLSASGSLDVDAAQFARPDFPQGLAAPLLAVPVIVDRRLEGFALYGGHMRGEALDPDERHLLEALARGAAAAYDRLANAALVRRISELETENAGLRHAQQLLVDAAQMLRNDAASLHDLVTRHEADSPRPAP